MSTSTSKKIYHAASAWDASMMLAREASERKAWRIAGGSVVLVLFLGLALVLLMPLKRTEPYVIRVDSATGVPDIVTTLKAKDVGKDEVTQKFFLADYVRSREAYDYALLQKDYDKTRLYSSIPIANEYAKLFVGDDALDKKYKDRYRITIEIQSVVPNSATTGTVRFRRTLKHVEDRNSPGVTTRWVATIAFTFNEPSSLKESERLINPFGFQVTSYRLDQEMGGGQ